jgi:hypothetical protein
MSHAIRLTDTDAALVKGMLRRGDKQHDIAAYFGVNSGRVAEIALGTSFAEVPEAGEKNLPPVGPYPVAGFLLLLHNAIRAKGEENVRRVLLSLTES